VIVLPDFVRETFTPVQITAARTPMTAVDSAYLEWRWDPDPNDDTYIVDYAFLMRDATGDVRVVHDRHIEGLFLPRPLARLVCGERIVGDELDRSVGKGCVRRQADGELTRWNLQRLSPPSSTG
jgi:hypothetical protein